MLQETRFLYIYIYIYTYFFASARSMLCAEQSFLMRMFAMHAAAIPFSRSTTASAAVLLQLHLFRIAKASAAGLLQPLLVSIALVFAAVWVHTASAIQ